MTLAETEAEMRRLAELVDAVESTSDSFLEPFRLAGVGLREIKRALVGAPPRAGTRSSRSSWSSSTL